MKTFTSFAASVLALAGIAAPSIQVAAQTTAPSPAPVAHAAPFTFEQVMIPMRDGARLQTVILRPRAASGPLPILFTRTPYGVPAAAPVSMPPQYAALARDGYVLVFQSMRGRFGSDGAFSLSTAIHPERPAIVDESTDAYDSIDWLVKHLPGTTGKVGMLGISYPGFDTAVTLVEPHPALKAASPQAAWIDYWRNDDLHRNGALRLSYMTDWVYSLQHDKDSNADFPYGALTDTYDWFLKLGPVENLDKRYLHGAIPMISALIDRPNHDAFYTGQDWSRALGRTEVPTLNVAGYWDQEDPWGSWQIWRKQRADDPRHLSLMVAGPWAHGVWGTPGLKRLGRIDYGVDSSTAFLEQVQAPFFAYWLHGKGTRPDWGVKSFQSGSWVWKTYAAWPVAGANPYVLQLHGDGRLDNNMRRSDSCRTYTSDPADPVPFRPRPIDVTYPGDSNSIKSPSTWRWWESEDQRFLQGRADVLSWSGEPLQADLTVTGEVLANLQASTTGTDGDFIVKLIDVYPDSDLGRTTDGKPLAGYQLPIAMEIRRGKFLASDTKPTPLVPGKLTDWSFSLRDHDHVFKAGHRIMVQIQSSWFPVIDRNPQTFVPNIAHAKPSDFRTATQRVCSGSTITLPVVR